MARERVHSHKLIATNMVRSHTKPHTKKSWRGSLVILKKVATNGESTVSIPIDLGVLRCVSTDLSARLSDIPKNATFCLVYQGHFTSV